MSNIRVVEETRSAELENGKKIELDCVKVKKEVLFEGIALKAYSICLYAYDENGDLFDSSEVDNVTTIESVADEIIALLRRNRVTPVSMCDVLEDYLAND